MHEIDTRSVERVLVYFHRNGGGSPSGYGEIKMIALPNSKMVVRYTCR